MSWEVESEKPAASGWDVESEAPATKVRRGGTRAEVRPFVAAGPDATFTGSSGEVYPNPAADPLPEPGGSVLDRPRTDFAPRARGALPAARASGLYDAQIGPIPKSNRLSDAAGEAIAKVTGSDTAGQATSRAVDLYASAGQILPQTLKIAADISQLATLGATAPISEALDRWNKGMDAQKSSRYQAQSAQLSDILRNPSQTPAAVLAFLASNPDYTANVLLPSLGSMAVGAGGASAGAKVMTALARRSGAGAAELAAAGDKGATYGAALTNALMNAGDTFDQTKGSLGDKYIAAGISGAGTAVTGRLTEGGAEAALVRGARPGTTRVGNTLRTMGKEGVQEGLEQIGNEAGQAVGEGRPLDANAIVKQAAVDATVGALSGAAAGAAMRPAAREPGGPADLQALMRSKGFAPAAPVAPRVEDMPTTPLTAEQLASIAPAPITKPAAPAGEGAVPSAPGGSTAGAPDTLGAAGLQQGSLAERAAAQLRALNGQPDVAVPAAVPAGAPDPGADQSGRGGGNLGPDAAGPERVGAAAQAPAPGGRGDPAAGAGGKADQALIPTGEATDLSKPQNASGAYSGQQQIPAQRGAAVPSLTFKTKGQALVHQVSTGMQGVTPIKTKVGWTLMSPIELGKAAGVADELRKLGLPEVADLVPTPEATDWEYIPHGQATEINPERITLGDEPKASSTSTATASSPTSSPASIVTAPRLQNRDRSDAAYVQQMHSIAANPDPARLSFSRDFATGAPVVLADSIPPDRLGRAESVTSASGRKIAVQYAAVEADDLLPSNDASGAANPGYADGAPGRVRVVAGNGRAAALQLAYERGTAKPYTKGIADDAALHGVQPQALAGMKRPVLVRVMQPQDVTANIGDESNVSGVAEKSAKEVARDDGRRLDLAGLEFDDDGNVNDATLRQFVDKMPVSEQTGLRDSQGNPTRAAQDRLMAAVFAQAYEDDALLALHAQAIDTEARVVMAGLAAAAPQMMQLKGAGDLDIRPIVAEAARAAVNARRRGIKLADMAAQSDLDTAPETRAVLQMLATNARSAKRIGEQLRAWAQMAYDEATKPSSDMFGDVPRATREQVLGSRDDTARPQDLGQPSRARTDALDDVRAETDAGSAADRQGADAERPAGSSEEAGLEPVPTAEPFKTAGAAMVYAVHQGIAQHVETSELPNGGGFVLNPKAPKASPATVESDERAVASGNRAVSNAGWLQPDGKPWQMKQAAKVPRAFTLLAQAIQAAFGIRVVPVTGAPGNGLQFGRHALVDVERSAGVELLVGVTGHEVKHWLDANDSAASKILSDAISQHLLPGAVARQQERENSGLVPGEKGIDAARARIEVEANINGALWLDPEFWGRLYEVDQGSTLRKVLYQFMRAATRFIRVTQGGAYDTARYVADVAAVREAAAQAWAQRANKPAQAGADEGPLVKGARRGSASPLDQDMFAPEAERPAFDLQAPTRADVLSQQQAREDEAKAEAKRRADRDEAERKDRERRDVDARMDASAENFQLGQDAEDALSGQGGLFGSRATPERQAKIDKAARAAAAVMPQFAVDDAAQLAARYPGPPAVDVPITTRVRLQAMLKPLMVAAEEANEQFKTDLNAAAAQVGGTTKTAGVKAEKRTIEKLHQEEEITGRQAMPNDIKDLVRGSLIVLSEIDIPSAIQEVRDRFDVIRVKDRFSEPLASGYRDVLINVRLPNGSVGEVQIHIPEMLAAKELGHLLYQVERALPPGAEKMVLEEAQARFYGEAYDNAGRVSNSATRTANSRSAMSPPPYATLEAGTSRPDTADTARPPGSSTTGPAPSTSSNRDPSGRDFQSNATSRSSAGLSDASILSREAAPAEYANGDDPFSRDYKALQGRQVEIKAATLDAAHAMRDLDERRDLAQRLVACVG